MNGFWGFVHRSKTQRWDWSFICALQM